MKTATKPLNEIAAQVDELGSLEKELLPCRPKLARVEVLRKLIRTQYDALPADIVAQPRGARFFAVVGPRGFQSTINPAKLIKAIGLKLYASLAKVTLGTLEENVDVKIYAGVVTVDQTGPRSLNTFELVA
jgi:hypothetical protein